MNRRNALQALTATILGFFTTKPESITIHELPVEFTEEAYERTFDAWTADDHREDAVRYALMSRTDTLNR